MLYLLHISTRRNADRSFFVADSSMRLPRRCRYPCLIPPSLPRESSAVRPPRRVLTTSYTLTPRLLAHFWSKRYSSPRSCLLIGGKDSNRILTGGMKNPMLAFSGLSIRLGVHLLSLCQLYSLSHLSFEYEVAGVTRSALWLAIETLSFSFVIKKTRVQ